MQKRHSAITILIVMVFGIGLFLVAGCSEGAGTDEAQATPLPPVQAPEGVVADGEVVPLKSVELRFELSGVVEEVLVEEGSEVEKGTPLVRLDTRDLEMAVEEAEANLATAQAAYDRLIAGATTEEISATQAMLRNAEALVAQASGELQRVRGQVTGSDIAAARAQVDSARARLNRLLSGADAEDIRQSQAQLDQALVDLQNTRDTLSAAKTRAYNKMEEAANTLRDLQQNYSGIYWENRERGQDWGSVNLDVEQKYKDREESALRAVRNGEIALEQARVAYEEAKQAEVTGIQQAEARVREQQARHEELLQGYDADEIAAARANLSQAQANLTQLLGESRQGSLASAQAALESAQADVERHEANLEDLTADPQTYELDEKLAMIQQREVALKQARLQLDKATLKAPFDGTVVEINPKEGEWFPTGEVAVVMADFSGWKIETTDLEEGEVVKVRVGSLVRISFDALPDLELPGRVTAIQNLGKNYQGDIVYKVTIFPQQWDDRLRWKMTATVNIEPETAPDAPPGAGPDAES